MSVDTDRLQSRIASVAMALSRTSNPGVRRQLVFSHIADLSESERAIVFETVAWSFADALIEIAGRLLTAADQSAIGDQLAFDLIVANHAGVPACSADNKHEPRRAPTGEPITDTGDARRSNLPNGI